MLSVDLTPAPGDSDNALRSLLDRVVDYEKAGAFVPDDLLQVGLFSEVVPFAVEVRGGGRV
jgi:hypothetical protein